MSVVPRSPIESAMELSNRDYRVFYVDVDSGDVKKMKFRKTCLMNLIVFIVEPEIK